MAVSKGCEGTLVWIYETMLSAYGFYTDSMDGAFGNNLDKAVKKFQESVGLEVDGSLGEDSVYALFNYKTFS
jgi:peptidoglycan hydrolase-like protein with peptidoglycan-binding domain